MLWKRYSEQGETGQSEAVRILGEYWRAHPTNEDAVRPLLEALAKREHFGQAEEYYAQLCAALAEEGKEPDQRTQDVIAFVRAMQIQRQPTIVSVAPVQVVNATLILSLAQQSALFKDMIQRNFSKGITYDLLSSNIRTMNFLDEWQYIVNNLVAESKVGLRAMVFDRELTRWWNTIAGKVYMKTNIELLKKGMPVKRIFIVNSLDMRLRRNALITAYVHHKIGIDVRVCQVTGFQESIPFKPDMFSVHDNLFVTLYYFSSDKPLTNLLLEDKYIAEFSSFYDELFRDDRLCTDIESVLAHSDCGEGFFASVKAQLELLHSLERVESVTELARKF